jgi:hypothetical protein
MNCERQEEYKSFYIVMQIVHAKLILKAHEYNLYFNDIAEELV